MNETTQLESHIIQYEFEIAIAASPENVWEVLTTKTNAWWLPDFRMVSPQSTVTLDTQAGGTLMERCANGGSLLWYTVQFCHPHQHTIYLLGHVAPDWGGPSTSHLKLSIHPDESGGSTFKVVDGQTGRVSKSSIDRVRAGWMTLFTDGLKDYAEK